MKKEKGRDRESHTSLRPAVVKQSTPSMRAEAPTKAVEMRRTW